MIGKIKRSLYFPLAYYFRLFAQIQLLLWKPRIIVITGSSGKTMLLNLLESQIQDRAEYSHQANSSFGIPFDILGLKRKTLTLDEWPMLFLLAPIRAFQKIHNKNLYIVEADCDRLGEGKFLATFLKPEVTIWLTSTRTHSVNFPTPVEESIAYEFGFFPLYTSELVIAGDAQLIKKKLTRTKANVQIISENYLEKFNIYKNHTEYKIKGKIFRLNYLLPKETFYQLGAMQKILNYLNIPLDSSFKKLELPPGRSSVFRGIKQTTIIDSSYNADLESMKVMLKMFDKLQLKKKWVVLGDMVEQGILENSEHEKLGVILSQMKLDKIILIGPRLAKYTYPKLKLAEKFDEPKEALNYLKKNIQEGEVIFFKGARFLEGIIEQILLNKSDVNKLCRREKVWVERRKKWKL